ncbi:hypothetical protein BGZ83_003658 [Gryganskiella cystojenkinii]|nr:hypothetical protein BGZ83_003658 [Gryganskiella cystojenkinii]
MADTTKSPGGRRLLRKSALQASPFGATHRSFNLNNNNKPPASLSPTPQQQQQQQEQAQTLLQSQGQQLPQEQQQQQQTEGQLNNINSFDISAITTDGIGNGSSSSSFSSSSLQLPPSATESSEQDLSPSRKSARLSALPRMNFAESSNRSPGGSNSPPNSQSSSQHQSEQQQPPRTPTRARLIAPSTPKKVILKTGTWGHVIGLRKQDESEYYRYPIDKSYVSFGRGDTNDIRVQIEGVSDLHCKLIRRVDGEVWLKDTSDNGTFLNDLLLQNTARPIQHADIMTIAGRKFRFDIVESTTSGPSQPPGTPGTQIRTINASIDKDILSLANVASPKPDPNRILSTTPKRNSARSAAALESSLGLFTPNRAAKLSSLLVSPKPVPLPAFLTQPMKPITPLKSTTPRKTYVMVDEPSILNPRPEMEDPFEDYSSKSMRTPTRDKRKASEESSPLSGRTPKKVSFGPALSPEIFDKTNPPSTPVKRGQQQDPDTPRRHGVSTPTLLSRLSAVGSSSKPILTPSKLRTGVVYNIAKPAPLNLSAFAGMDENDSPQPAKTPEKLLRQEPLREFQDDEIATVDDNTLKEEVMDKESDERAVSMSPDDGWKKLTAISQSHDVEKDNDSIVLESLTSILSSELGPDDADDQDESAPSTPTRPTPTRPLQARISSPPVSTPTRTRHLPLGTFAQHAMGRNSSPLGSDDESLLHPQGQPDSPSPSAELDDPTSTEENNPFIVRLVDDNLEHETEERYASPPENDNMEPSVHTPIHFRRPAEDIYHHDHVSTPESTPRKDLQELADHTIHDLSGSPQPWIGYEDMDYAPSTPTRVNNVNNRHQLIQASDQAQVTQTEQDTESNDVPTNAPEELESAGDSLMRTPSPEPNTRHLSVFSTVGVPSRRLSAPASSTSMEQSQSPIFAGLRAVFRTPQKVAEFGYASFAGIRNYVRTPTKTEDVKESDGTESHRPAEAREELVSNLEVQTPEDEEKEELLWEQTGDQTAGLARTTTPTTPMKPIGSHQDALAILVGGEDPLSPKSREFSFVSSSKDSPLVSRGRRSDNFPQRRAMAVRSQSHSDVNRHSDSSSDVDKSTNRIARRRTISLTEFKHVASRVFSFGGSGRQQASQATTASDSSSDKENEPQSIDQQHQGTEISKEDAEQAELLRLLGEGGSEDMDYSEDIGVVEQEDLSGLEELQAQDDTGDQAAALYGGADDEAVYVDESKMGITPSSSRRSSGVSTPSSRRRWSLKHRLGSSSPAFRHYEQQDDGEDEDENDDDMVMMISPKRVRVHPYRNIHQSKYAPHNKRKLADGEIEPVSMKEKVARDLELAKLRKQVVTDKPKKTIKKKPMSTKAKIRREKTLERGLMNAEKDEKRIDKHHVKVTLKKRGKQMWE